MPETTGRRAQSDLHIALGDRAGLALTCPSDLLPETGESRQIAPYMPTGIDKGSRIVVTIYLVCRHQKEGTMATAYCMKCRKKVEMRNPMRVTLKNGRPATRGVCPVCSTKVFRIGKA